MRDPATQNEFIVKYNEEPTLKGSYAFKYKTYYTNYPANFVELQNAIILTIIDPCDEPVAVIPSSLTDQEYTITQAAFDYEIPAYTADPLWCSITYTYTISAIEGDAIVTLDEATPKFTFFEPNNLALSGKTQTDYTVTVIGTVGNLTPVSEQASFNLRV